MSECQLLFNTPMIRAILEGRKTQARLAITPQPAINKAGKPYWRTRHDTPQAVSKNACPYGKVGSLLLVREAFTTLGLAGIEICYRATPLDHAPEINTNEEMDLRKPLNFTLAITGVRVERLQSITAAECFAEGYQPVMPYRGKQERSNALLWYRTMWEAEHGAGSWAENPWVWVLLFERPIKTMDRL